MKVLRATYALLLLAATVRPCAAETGACPTASHAHAHAKASACASARATCVKNATPADQASASMRGPAAGAHRCSMPYATPCDLGASATATSPARVTAADDAGSTLHHSHLTAPVINRTVQRVPQPSGEPPAFGPLFIAHQALML